MSEKIEEGGYANYAMKMRQENPAKMEETEEQVKRFLEHSQKSGLLKENESLNDNEIMTVANRVINRLHRKLSQNEPVSEAELNSTIEDALLSGVAERLDMKKKGLSAPEV